MKREVQSKVDYQILKGTQDWSLLELLFDHVSRMNSQALIRFCRQVYGDAIEIVPRHSATTTKDFSFREHLSKIKSQAGVDLRRELSSMKDRKISEDFYLEASLKNYLPPLAEKEVVEENDKWITSKELESLQEQLTSAMNSNDQILKLVEEAQKYGGRAVEEAMKWRENHDFHM